MKDDGLGRSDRSRVHLWAHLFSLAAIAGSLLFINRDQWFFNDEWDFITDRGIAGGAELHLFVPHNEHWSTIPILIYRAIFSIFGLKAYLPYIVPLIALHLLVVHLLWRLMLRVGVNEWIAVATTAAFGVFGAGSENLLWAFQIGFVGSIAAGLVEVYLVDQDDTLRRRVLAYAAGLAALMCSGLGVLMVAASGLVCLARRGLKAAALHTAPLAAVFLLWLLIVDNPDVSTNLQSPSLETVVTAVIVGLKATLNGLTTVSFLGWIMLTILVGWMVSSLKRHLPLATPILALAVAAVALFAMVSLGRAADIDLAGSSRYVYVAGALLLPALALLLSDMAPRRGMQLLLLFAICVVGVRQAQLLSGTASAEAEREAVSRGKIVAAAELLRAGAQTVSDLPDAQYAINLDTMELLLLAEKGQLPRGYETSETDELAAAASLQVAIGEQALDLGALPSVTGPITSAEGNCAEIEGGSQVTLTFSTPGSASISSGGGEVIVDVNRDGLLTRSTSAVVEAGQEIHLNSSFTDGTVIVTFPPGAALICGVRV